MICPVDACLATEPAPQATRAGDQPDYSFPAGPIFGWEVSKRSATVGVGPNQTVTLKYRPPLIVTSDANVRHV